MTLSYESKRKLCFILGLSGAKLIPLNVFEPTQIITERMARPVLQQKVSLDEYLQSRYEDSLKFEERLNRFKPNDQDASHLRIKVCEYLTDLILTDPNFACQHGIVERLWRLCFYDRIRMLRGSRDKLKRKGEDFGKVQDALMKHVSEAISLYNYLTETLEDKLMKAYPALSGTQASEEESDDDASRPGASKAPEGIMKCLIPMIVQLGDLHRYGESTSQAQVAYKRAIQLGPGIGHAMNQLAVILSQADPAGQRLVTLYWYARSISVTAEPFSTSAKNLVRLFEANHEWLSKQENEQQSSAANAKSAQSKQFLAKFCQLHSVFFNGFLPDEMDGIGVFRQMKECRELLSNLLQNSALGDSLLCKLVTIHAFSETVAERARSPSVPNSDQLMQATAWAARVSTLWLGTALAQRVLRTPNRGQQQKKTQSSYRCLVPMMLVAEYVSTRPIPGWKDFGDIFGEPELVALHVDAEKEFWKSIVDVLNHIQLQSSDVGRESMAETALLLKEYLELRGFLPFATFTAGISDCGRLSDEDAVKELSARRKGKDKIHESASTLTSGASIQSSNENGDQNRIKVVRFLALGQKWANDCESDFAQRIHFDEEGKLYSFVDSENADDEDDHMVLSNEDDVDHATGGSDNEISPPLLEPTNAPVVYHKSSDGGPELLLPSYLLEQNRQIPASGAALHSPMDTSDASSFFQKPSAFTRVPPHQLGHVDPVAPSNFSVAAVGPPPGFGGSLSQPNMSTNNEQAQQAPLYRLFGADDLRTSNPFADTHYQAASLPFEANLAAARHYVPNDDLFGHQDDFGAFLDSGLWSSIFKDDPPPPTSNPFAT